MVINVKPLRPSFPNPSSVKNILLLMDDMVAVAHDIYLVRVDGTTTRARPFAFVNSKRAEAPLFTIAPPLLNAKPPLNVVVPPVLPIVIAPP